MNRASFRTPTSEAYLQRQVCDYLRLQYPGVIFRSDFASGLKLTMGQAVQHKSLQSSRAWPDLGIYEPSRDGAHHGLFIEIKAEGNSPFRKDGTLKKDEHVEEQAKMLDALRRRGYSAHFGTGFDEIRLLIDTYLGHRRSADTSPF